MTRSRSNFEAVSEQFKVSSQLSKRGIREDAIT